MSKAKGSRAERKTIRALEASGYVCTKAGGSLGIFDVIAIGPAGVRAIQVKCGSARLSGLEREQIQGLNFVPYVSKEYWRWPDYAREPLIEVIR